MRWRKSSFSGGNDNGNGCVEVAFHHDGAVLVRDTKDRSIPARRYPAAEWAAFLAGVQAGEFDRP
jgi:hypothetical protein